MCCVVLWFGEVVQLTGEKVTKGQVWIIFIEQ